MPKVSVLFGSARPGGLDITLPALAAQTYDDFEVVFVDGRYHKRHAQVLDYLKEIGFKKPFYHIPNVRYNGIWATSSNGFNTELMLADGEYVMRLMDYSYVPPDWVENHMALQDRTMRGVIGPHIYLNLPPLKTKDGSVPVRYMDSVNWTGKETLKVREVIQQQYEAFDEISAFAESFKPSSLDTLETLAEFPPAAFSSAIVANGGRIEWNWLHNKNESYPLEALFEVNGTDENYDKGLGPGDLEMGYRLRRLGMDFILNMGLACFTPNPRIFLPNLRATLAQKWTTPEDKALNEGRWSNEEGLQYYNARLSEVNATGNLRSKTPYDMRKMREKIWVWRELSQEREAVIPLNQVPDSQWFDHEYHTKLGSV